MLKENEKIIIEKSISNTPGATLQQSAFSVWQEIMPMDDTAEIQAFSSFLELVETKTLLCYSITPQTKKSRIPCITVHTLSNSFS